MLFILYETLNVVISISSISGYVQTAVKSDLFIKSDRTERVCALSFASDSICMDCCGSNVGVSHYVCSCRRFSKLKHEKKCRLPIDNAVRSQSKQLISEEFSDMSDQSEMQL